MTRQRNPQTDMLSASRLKSLETRIGIHFSNLQLLQRALTHPSALDRLPEAGTNQRFEFMGDRILGFIIAEALLERFPHADEGELALLYNALVRKEACAAVADKLDLGTYLFLGPGEERAGGRKKPAILADACEALVAAIYFEAGLEAVRIFVLREWQPLFDAPPKPGRDAKTTLQEWAQSKGFGLPSYRVKGRSGPDHAPLFVVEVEIKGMKPVEGIASSKRQAEQAAAEALLSQKDKGTDERSTD